MILLTLFLVLIGTILVKYFLHMRHMESYVKHLNMPKPFYPLFGNVTQLIGKTATQMLEYIMDYTKKTETPYKMYIGPTLVVVIDKPEDVKRILTSESAICKPYVYNFYPNPNGVLTTRCKFIALTTLKWNIRTS